MKVNKAMVATLLILIGVGAITVSCRKEKPGSLRATLVAEDHAFEKTGGDDEEPIIQIRVRKKNGLAAVDSAYVETYTSGTNVRVGSVYSNSLGECSQQVPVGTYYFKVTSPGASSPSITDTLDVVADTTVTILVD